MLKEIALSISPAHRGAPYWNIFTGQEDRHNKGFHRSSTVFTGRGPMVDFPMSAVLKLTATPVVGTPTPTHSPQSRVRAGVESIPTPTPELNPTLPIPCLSWSMIISKFVISAIQWCDRDKTAQLHFLFYKHMENYSSSGSQCSWFLFYFIF